MAALGYQILTKDMRDSSVFPYLLQIWREDKTDSNSIDTTVLELFDLATENHADYDGWETSVEKSQT